MHLDAEAIDITDYRGRWNIQMVVKTIKDAVQESVPQVRSIAAELKRGSLQADAAATWNFVRENVRYVEDQDAEGHPAEKIKVAARTLREGEGDCEDMTILASAILINMGYSPSGVIIKQSGPQWSHIFATVGDQHRSDSGMIKGYVIDAVPEIPAFDAIAPSISKVMEIEFLRGIQGSRPSVINGFGCVVAPSPVTSKLQEHQANLLTVAGLGSADDGHNARQLRKTRALILMNGLPEQEELMPVMDYVHDVSPTGELIFTPDAPLEAITEYLSAMNGAQLGGVGRATKRRDLRDKAKKEQERDSKKSPAEKKKKAIDVLKKAGHVIVKYNPVTIAMRNGVLLAMRLNLFKIAERLHYAYFTDSQAVEAGIDAAELAKLRQTMRDIEKVFATFGGKAENLKASIVKGGEKGLKGLGIVVAATATAGTAAATPFLVKVGELLKKLNFKKLLEKIKLSKVKQTLTQIQGESPEVPDDDQPTPSPEGEGFKDGKQKSDYETAQRQAGGDNNSGNTDQPDTNKGDNTLLYLALGAGGLFFLTKML